MKLQIECNSPITQKTLENFLSEYISFSVNDKNDFDFILTDKKKENFKNISNKKIITVSFDEDSDIKRPFTKKELEVQLRLLSQKTTHLSKLDSIFSGESLEELELEISRITKIYLDEVHRIIREFYENKRNF
jgi:hypothetical protein